MNPSWIPAICTLIGIIINVVWSIVNTQARADQRAENERLRAELAGQIAALKEWMRGEYVNHEVCGLRMNDRGRDGRDGRDA